MLTEGLCFCCSKYIDNSSDSEQEEEEGRKAHGKGYWEERLMERGIMKSRQRSRKGM